MNAFQSLIDILESIVNSISEVFDFLVNDVTIGDFTFRPLTGLIAILGGLLVLWLLKKIIPVL